MLGLLPWRRERTRGRELVPSSEAEPLARLRDEIQGLFDEFAARFRWPAEFGLDWRWGMEVRDERDRVVVELEAPGFEPEDFDVRVSGNLLTVRARHAEEETRRGSYYRRYGSVHRAITLPPGVDAAKAEARYHRGILEITIPKLPEESRGRKVLVKSGA